MLPPTGQLRSAVMENQPAPPAPRRFEAGLGWLCVGVLGALAVASALWSLILLPPPSADTLVPHPSQLPRLGESLLLAGPALFYITLYAGRAARSRIGALIPALFWFIVVVAVSAGRPEGDTAYLLASFQGLLLAPLGMVAAALGISRSAHRPWPLAVRRPAPVIPDASLPTAG